MTDFPSHLYHYTTIQGLACILATSRIRFRRLDLVNDPEDGASQDLPGIEYHVFASCWTDQEDESIPMWKHYTGDMKGCRIRLPLNPFNGDLKGTEIKLRDPVYYKPPYFRGEDAHIHTILGPTEIEYSEEFPKSFVEKSDGGAKYDASSAGLIKKEHWEFEHEWRYRIHTQPVGEEFGFTESDDGREHSFVDLQFKIPLNSDIDVPISNDALKDLQITLGPHAGDGGYEIAKTLTEKFARNATITRSEVRIRKH